MQVLRQFDGECAALLRSGTNALDEPIPSPVDGFCRVPGRHPPRFVLIECTTTEPADLRAKWLSGWSRGAEGDEQGSRSDKAGDLVEGRARGPGTPRMLPGRFV